MQKPLYTMPEIIDWLNELDNPKQTIEDQDYTLSYSLKETFV